nr:DUF2759 family protein [Bacilli bacterium]
MMPPLHYWWMMIVLLLFTLMAVYGLYKNLKDRRVFPSVVLAATVFVFGYTTFFIVTPW